MALLDHPSSDIGAVYFTDRHHPAVAVRRRPRSGDDVLSDPIDQGKTSPRVRSGISARRACKAASFPAHRNLYTDAMDLDRIAIDMTDALPATISSAIAGSATNTPASVKSMAAGL